MVYFFICFARKQFFTYELFPDYRNEACYLREHFLGQCFNFFEDTLFIFGGI